MPFRKFWCVYLIFFWKRYLCIQKIVDAGSRFKSSTIHSMVLCKILVATDKLSYCYMKSWTSSWAQYWFLLLIIEIMLRRKRVYWLTQELKSDTKPRVVCGNVRIDKRLSCLHLISVFSRREKTLIICKDIEIVIIQHLYKAMVSLWRF